jgi:hypothetical protein
LSYSLKREEILRGFDIFEDILTNSKKISFGCLSAYLNLTEMSPGIPVKAGFLISKKKLKKHTIETSCGDC